MLTGLFIVEFMIYMNAVLFCGTSLLIIMVVMDLWLGQAHIVSPI